MADNILGKQVHDILSVRVVSKQLLVNSSTAVLAAVGVANLPLRKLLRILNKDTVVTVYYNDTVAGANSIDGFPIYPGEIETIAVGPGVTIYLKSGSGSGKQVIVQEGY